jgi:hypothetical protein
MQGLQEWGCVVPLAPPCVPLSSTVQILHACVVCCVHSCALVLTFEPSHLRLVQFLAAFRAMRIARCACSPHGWQWSLLCMDRPALHGPTMDFLRVTGAGWGLFWSQ